jgi:hypothetical protein
MSVENTLVNNCRTGLRFHRTATGHASFSTTRSRMSGSTLRHRHRHWRDSAAVPDLFSSAFISTVVWGQTDGAICARVAGTSQVASCT